MMSRTFKTFLTALTAALGFCAPVCAADVSMLQQQAEFTVEGYPFGSETLENFPLLVRISETRIPGFLYETAESDGGDVRFTDEGGNLLPCEIDTWDRAGESLAWVLVPRFRNGVKVTMHWDLKRGYAAPSNNPKSVWGEYMAVWHMSPADLAAGRAEDSSGNGFVAKVDGGGTVVAIETNGVAGAAAYASGGTGSFVAAKNYETLTLDGSFTFTGWYQNRDCGEVQTTPLFGTKYAKGQSLAATDERGWCGFQFTPERFVFQYSGNAECRYPLEPRAEPLSNGWYHVAIACTAAQTADLYLDGSYAVSPTRGALVGVDFPVISAARPFQVMRYGVCGDEIRITRKIRSAAWIAAEAASAKDPDYLTATASATKGRYNYWLDEPSITPNAWTPDTAGSVVFNEGRARFGVTVVTYYDFSGARLVERPTALGRYRAVFEATDGLHDTVSKEIYFVIHSERGYSALSGSDRVMLFNDDDAAGGPVRGQGFWDVDAKGRLVWEHSDETWKGSGSFVQDGASHTYFDPETHQALWKFSHARIGNLFQSETGLAAGMNFLPWSATARRYDDSEKPCDHQRYAGCLILQNVSTATAPEDPAEILSPLYTNGIGTVYFDAVNAYGSYVNRLSLEVRLGETAPWKPLPCDVFAIVEGAYDVSLSATNAEEIVLGMSKATGTTDWFYRIRAHVGTTGEAQIRIRRTDSPATGWGTGGEDGEGLVLVDNLIVSPPPMGVRLEQYGAPANESDRSFRGQRAPFSVPFPSVSDAGTLRGAVRADPIVNGTNVFDASFVDVLTMTYRWRYLDQAVGDWKTSVMVADASDPTCYLTSAPLDFEEEGDLEYRFSAVVNAPFYTYCDYSGLSGWSWPDGYSERGEDVSLTAEAEGLYDAEHPSSAFGTDYFVRIREGASAYEGWRLHVKRAGEEDAAERVIAMELVSDNVWRGFYQTLTNVEAGLLYRLEAVNRQTAALADYQFATNHYCGSAEMGDFGAPDALDETDGSVWGHLPCDALTGYLLFQIDDQGLALTVIHADYQNFNGWTDANLPDGDQNGHFVGTSTLDEKKIGVSAKVQSFSSDFAGCRATETVATNTLWEEHFDVEASETGPYAIEQFNAGTVTTPNGWRASSCTWVPQTYRTLGGESIALQLKGQNYGQVLFQIGNMPQGLETFSFNARIAQSYDIFSFNYCRAAADASTPYWSRRDCTFAAHVSMREAYDDEFEGLGTVSLVGYYTDDTGCYELRVERTAERSFRLCLYKWSSLDGAVEPTFLGASGEFDTYSGTGLAGASSSAGAAFIACQTDDTRGCTRVTGGLMSQSQPIAAALGGQKYYVVSYEDFDDDRLTSGTFGLGSKDCPALFARPESVSSVPAWSTASCQQEGHFRWWNAPRTISFGGTETLLLNGESDFEKWTVRKTRLPAKTLDYATGKQYGFKAQPTEQYVLVETAPHGTSDYTLAATNWITSFGFTAFTNRLYLSDTVDCRITTGSSKSGPDVVVDDFVARRWAGISYNDEQNPDYALFNRDGQIGYGSPTNFVYTSGWIGEAGAEVELSAMRTPSAKPASVRAPLMDGLNGRGLGLGMFSYSYRAADRRARLLVQIATNESHVALGNFAGTTASLEASRWTTVATNDFSEMTDEARLSGLVTTYIGLHGVKGAIRVVMDPEVCADAQNASVNPERDPSYGRVYVTGAAARDNPVLDTGSWWGWNLRTTDDPMKWLLKDGTKTDPEAAGMALALNNSVADDIREDEADLYPQHKPFVQSPVFVQDVVGEVSFRARKYSAGDAAPTVAVYGTHAKGAATDDEQYEYLGEIPVTSARYKTYSFQVPVSKRFTGFRLAVTGVPGVVGEKGPDPASGDVARVLIDEVAVFQSIQARLAFRRTGAFRYHLADLTRIKGLPSADEQPLLGEPWGVQTELYASMLSDRIDRTRSPRVYLHWFAGPTPWGYENWCTNASAREAELSRVSGEELVYRSSYLGDVESVIDDASKSSVIQYALVVSYYMVGQSDPLTCTLSASDWQRPSWYAPVDYNASLGGRNGGFAAYCLLDEVAPGWAWINEVNVFGDRVNYVNTDEDCQYVEVAVPQEADITGWSLRMLVPETSSGSIVTNRLCTFGSDGLSGKKTGNLGMASNMVFRVIANRATRDKGELKTSDGTLDGVWSVQEPGQCIDEDGTISYYQAFGLQLVRASGAVAHEIVAIGTNVFESSKSRSQYDPTNVVNYLNARVDPASFFVAGKDCGGLSNSVGVFASRGEGTNVWNNSMARTPGRINAAQQIASDHPVPMGSAILIYANVLGDHLRQTVGDAVDTNVNQVITVPKGSATGTNILYRTDRWYELGTVTTNGAPVGSAESCGTRTWRLTVGVGCSNNITVNASAAIDSRLRDLGVTETNKYAAAVIDWLEKGRNMDGEEWPEGEVIYPADLIDNHGTSYRKLTLTEMYWLDICPLVTNQCLIAGLAAPPAERYSPTLYGDIVTNVRYTVYAMITNRTEDALSEYYGKAWPPYVIRGLEPGSSSWDYATNALAVNWSNATFKASGILLNGLTSVENSENWVPLRYFVFDKNSFNPNGTSEIDVPEGHSPGSIGYVSGWGDWFRKHPDDTSIIGYFWTIDTRLKPFTVEVLKPQNYLDPD